jgi:FkbM family methyltransferase
MRRWLRGLYRSVVPEPIPPCDTETIQVLERVLKPDSNGVDIGCNRGSILREIVRLAPLGRHFAFEPIPSLFRQLARRFPQVSCHPLALSDTKGVATFNYFTRYDGFSGLVRRQIDIDPGPIQELEVQTDKLDDILPIDLPIDLIKIDVEGAEHEVLRGAEGVLRRSRPTVVFECGQGGLDLYGRKPEQLYEVLSNCGLSIRLLKDWDPNTPALSQPQFIKEFHNGAHYMFVASARE